MREAIRGHQRPPEAIRGHQRPPEAIRGHQRQSEAIRGHPRRHRWPTADSTGQHEHAARLEGLESLEGLG